jgi:uncharacterized protein YndB with AHSA1/START domain
MNDTDATLEELEGQRWNVSFERTLPHPPEKVWRALTEAEHLKAWFPTTIEGGWDVGAPLRFAFEDHPIEPMSGEVLVCDPPKVLEFTWGEDTLRFELEPVAGGTHLMLVDTIVELGKAARDGAGWHVKLQELARVLDGDTPPFEVDDWRPVNERYKERFGPAASTLGPPEGME